MGRQERRHGAEVPKKCCSRRERCIRVKERAQANGGNVKGLRVDQALPARAIPMPNSVAVKRVLYAQVEYTVISSAAKVEELSVGRRP